MKYFSKEIIIPIAGLIAIVLLVYMEKIWSVVSGWNPSVFVAIASAFIAGCALWANIREGKATRKHNKLSVRPLLSMGESSYMKDSLYHTDINLTNKGTGSAIIKTFILRYDGKVKSCDNLQDYENFIEEELKGCIGVTTSSYLPDAIMKAGEERTIVSAACNTPAQNKKIEDFINRFDIYIEYQSIYQDEIFIRDSETYRGRDGRKFPGEEPFIMPSEVQRMAKVQRMAQVMANIYTACLAKPHVWNAHDFANLLESPNGIGKIVTYGDRVHGFVAGQWLDDTQTEILTLAIVPHEQGKGRGRAMLKDFITEVKKQGGKSIFLEVAENNVPALHLYKKAGFKKVGLRTAYYKVPDAPPVDAILMRLDIKTPLPKIK